MYNIYKILIISFFLVAPAYSVDVVSREGGGGKFIDNNTTLTGIPTKLKFFKFYDNLPDTMTFKILNQKDMSSFAGKHIYVGYGTVDPHGKNCREYPPTLTGLDHNVTICLPWWRIERTYQRSIATVNDIQDIICSMPTPHPPLKVDVCKTWIDDGSLNTPGGRVTCTTYYNRLLSTDCWNNPLQSKCYVDNCSNYVREHCNKIGTVMGDKTAIETATSHVDNYSPTDTKLGVLSLQFECPAGTLTPHQKCADETSVLMYPYACTEATEDSDGDYIYCDEDKPQYDDGGNILGFLGTCPDGRTVMCDVNGLAQTSRKCVEPIYANKEDISLTREVETRNYDVYTVDVLSGETDTYSDDPNCVRANTVSDARDQMIYAKIIGNGYLDDDVWIFRHRADGSHLKVYCNEQHNEDANSTKMYNGVMEQCIDNDGSYSFDQEIEIQASDIVTVQQATENENDNGAPFSLGRTNYSSTELTIDGVSAIPEISHSTFPYYPNNRSHLKLWDNTLGSLSILFPYAGSYVINFYNGVGEKVAEKALTIEDFNDMHTAYLKLGLAKHMEYYPGFDKNASTACLDDSFTEWGGGVYGGHNSKTNDPCQSPDDSFSQNHAVYKIIIKDLLTGSIIPIKLIYPLAYPNMVFVSKLKLYEKRKYRCYEPFSDIH